MPRPVWISYSVEENMMTKYIVSNSLICGYDVAGHGKDYCNKCAEKLEKVNGSKTNRSHGK